MDDSCLNFRHMDHHLTACALDRNSFLCNNYTHLQKLLDLKQERHRQKRRANIYLRKRKNKEMGELSDPEL